MQNKNGDELTTNEMNSEQRQPQQPKLKSSMLEELFNMTTTAFSGALSTNNMTKHLHHQQPTTSDLLLNNVNANNHHHHHVIISNEHQQEQVQQQQQNTNDNHHSSLIEDWVNEIDAFVEKQKQKRLKEEEALKSSTTTLSNPTLVGNFFGRGMAPEVLDFGSMTVPQTTTPQPMLPVRQHTEQIIGPMKQPIDLSQQSTVVSSNLKRPRSVLEQIPTSRSQYDDIRYNDVQSYSPPMIPLSTSHQSQPSIISYNQPQTQSPYLHSPHQFSNYPYSSNTSTSTPLPEQQQQSIYHQTQMNSSPIYYEQPQQLLEPSQSRLMVQPKLTVIIPQQLVPRTSLINDPPVLSSILEVKEEDENCEPPRKKEKTMTGIARPKFDLSPTFLRSKDIVFKGFTFQPDSNKVRFVNSEHQREGINDGAWSEREHELFLLGLEKCGKGRWRDIAEYYVKTRTRTQVASHAQKYFQKQKKSSPSVSPTSD